MTEKPYNTLNDLTYKTFLPCVKQRETKNLTEKSKMKVKNEEKSRNSYGNSHGHSLSFKGGRQRGDCNQRIYKESCAHGKKFSKSREEETAKAERKTSPKGGVAGAAACVECNPNEMCLKLERQCVISNQRLNGRNQSNLPTRPTVVRR